MSDDMWKAMAYLRMGVECEILRQENAALRQQLEAAKGPHEVEQQKEATNASESV